MRAAAFAYHAPTSIDEALTVLSQHGDDARLLAGGQSLVPTMTARLARPTVLIDLNRIENAALPTISAGRLRVPPLMRHADFERLSANGPLSTILAELSGHIGHLPIRMRGTFCGALAHADPAAEWCLASVVLGAELLVRSMTRGVRNIEAADFFESMMDTTLADDEMIIEAQIPLLPAATRYGFSEICRRSGDYALASTLVVYQRDEDEMTKVRLGVGGVEATPRRIPEAEAMLERREPTRQLFREVADLVASAVDPVSDLAADADYRRELTRAAVSRALDRSFR
ncbi:FAD binding domain-containing protein [Acuticoccus sp. M5D2P5]|uniref:FAD binding domain-containing protein n=1 Tax=Acuticoccus kalidii TaxID=2910977 RepID=UPI001F2DDB53|nr:FAD binding domain-containing protein [Acuticoccus kalidii]